eukprot:TRINITY_DN9777_c0_g3_i1.p1 TRINITY_DN9777_c0_g3~~TRINITY_DN9777_c0_g3_i1.p1  ORF type:complete len:252 (-),score=84.35 TRINITY_DN9777_c0_g3_i1:106-861(-)
MVPVLTYCFKDCRKIAEKEGTEREIDAVWKEIHELTQEVKEVEKCVAEMKDECCKIEEVNGENSFAALSEKLNKLHEEKKKIRSDYEIGYNEYKSQQNILRNAKLIARRKQELVKLRAQEEIERKAQLAKCEELIMICRKILLGHQSEENPQIESSKKKIKGKKKLKAKKTEALNVTEELENLRERFVELGVAAPKEKSGINSTIKTLLWKLKEIEERPLSVSIPINSNDCEDNESTRSSSFFFDTTEDFK